MSTIKDVAELADVSIATVSRVLNGTSYVSPDLETRVLQAVRKLNYHPNVLARSLRLNESNMLGVLIPNSMNPYFAEVAKGIDDYCLSEGFVGVLCDTDDNPSKALRYLNLLYRQRAAGFIVTSPGQVTDHLEQFISDGFPIVLVDRGLSSVNTDSVISDNIGGARQAVRYLVELGHQRIGFIVSNLEHETVQGRWAGVQEAMQHAGIAIDPEMVYTHGDELPGTGYDGARVLFEHAKPPSAIFAFNDLMALGVLNYAQEHGIEVPTQLSVVGFDDSMLANYASPKLTTIKQPTYELGQEAAKLILRRIQGDDSPVEHLVLPTKLIVRNSAAPVMAT